MDDNKTTMSQWATHMPALAWAVLNTTGPIVECGTGTFSTPFLRTLADIMKRSVLSLETSVEWVGKCQPPEGSRHKVVLVGDWAVAELPDERCGVILIDQAPGSARQPMIERVANLADIIVIHDTEPGTGYGYDLSGFKFSHDWSLGEPTGAMLVSNVRPVAPVEVNR